MDGLNFPVELEGVDELERALDATAIDMSDAIRKAVAESVKAGADEARRNHFYQDRTGKLTGSIRGYVEVSTPGAAVGVIECKTKYDRFVEKGTPPHDIQPKRKKALAWPGGEHPVKIVHHPGTEPKPFMAQAGKFAERHLERSIESEMLHNIEKHLSE